MIPIDEYVKDLDQAPPRIKVTFAYRFIMSCNAGVVRTILKYCCWRLDNINAALPDDNLGKIRHQERINKYLLQGDEVL